MDAAVDEVVNKCFPCQIATPKPSRELLKMTPLPDGPWQQVSIDFCEVAEHYVLVVIDDYSRLPEVEIVHLTSAKVVFPELDRVFAAYDVPQVVKSDNGPPFNLGFKHRRVTPLWPEANGEVECFMKTFGMVLRTTLTGSNTCTGSCETIEQLLIVLLASLLPLPSLEDQSRSSCPALLLFHVSQS